MPVAALQDIDELVLTCRSPRTRELIAEAVACYKSGAYRACVVATWVAIAYDVIGKLEELEAAGSLPAGAVLTPLRHAQVSPEAERAAGQAFERTVLDRLVGADLELISHQEHFDLKRLFEDRHRCAHPSMSAGFEPYAMSAEQARTHLRNAVTCLLQHPPAQGKFAKDRIFALIQSDLFPEDVADATEALRHTTLPGGRTILVKAVVLGLTTSLLREDRPTDERRRQFAALAAARRIRTPEANASLAQNLNAYVASLDVERLDRAVEFVGKLEDTWHLLDPGQHARLTAFVPARVSQLSVDVLRAAVQVAPLRLEVEARASEIPIAVLGNLLQVLDLPAMADVAVQRFVGARSFAAALSTSRALLVPAAARLTAEHLGSVLNAYATNDQVYGCHGIEASLVAVLGGAEPASLAAISAQSRQVAVERLDVVTGGDQARYGAFREAITG